MSNKLKIISFNCQSLNANAAIIEDLLGSCDILCLQETLIDHNNAQNLNQFDNNFMVAYEPAYRQADVFTGRSSGGLTIFWKSFLNINISPLFFDKRVMGLKLSLPGGCVLLLLNVYLICDYEDVDSFIEYKSTLATIDNILENESYSNVCIMGDWNADPTKGRFFNLFRFFCEEKSLIAEDIANLPPDSFTYISSNSNCSTSWLDHVVCSDPGTTTDHKILYGTTVSDHIPLLFYLNIPVIAQSQDIYPTTANSLYYLVNWDKVTLADQQNYAEVLDSLCLELPQNVLCCNNEACRDPDHIKQLDELYHNIFDCISLANMHLPSYSSISKEKRVVGWNEYCKEKYFQAREKFFVWHRAGKPRTGDIFSDMKSARSAFKNAIRYCRKNELQIKKEILLNKFSGANKTVFWKNISKINGSWKPNVLHIDEKSNLNEITEIFDKKYKKILDDPSCQTGEFSRLDISSNGVYEPLVTAERINYAIDRLNTGRGWDNVHSNNFKFSGPIFRNLIGKYINKLLDHAFLPHNMMYGEIRPIVKNNSASKRDSDNFRPVMNSSMFLKILEYSMLPVLKRYLVLNNRQFGFRANTGCIPAVALVKEVISKYNNENSSVHCAMLDLSKAFDRVNKNILFKKLAATDLNPRYINILHFMYDNSYVHTIFNGVKKTSWKIGNGVRQGGILSPLLFSFYINDVLNTVADQPDGCSIEGYMTNIVCFADDLILLSPSVIGLQKLIDKVASLFDGLCLKINTDKSVYMNFIRQKMRNCGCTNLSSNIHLNRAKLKHVSEYKYLGVFLSIKNELAPDINRILDSFLKQFNAMYSKFYFCDKKVLFFLFKAYASSFYGIETWIEKIFEYQINRISVAYHKAIKRMCGLKTWDSNHEACNMAGLLLFRHMWAKRQLCFWYNLCYSKSPCNSNLKYYFLYSSNLAKRVTALFSEKYNVDVRSNPLCAILSRILFVQSHEPSLFHP